MDIFEFLGNIKKEEVSNNQTLANITTLAEQFGGFYDKEFVADHGIIETTLFEVKRAVFATSVCMLALVVIQIDDTPVAIGLKYHRKDVPKSAEYRLKFFSEDAYIVLRDHIISKLVEYPFDTVVTTHDLYDMLGTMTHSKSYAVISIHPLIQQLIDTRNEHQQEQ